ncbi:uncharacterized protein LOC115617698 isoform X2 [Strigops habroptila]|uniref:uncharacterized protein LOC115617698 isoform X2 n=1 Tax=Strigops habroptila TaxID=2489341 RepID=UPI0011CEF6FB|nr:uncharacterized protein LOC115617698 isoform X2 [Strigops habroptila]
MLLGARILCCLLLALLQRGFGDTEYGDLEDEGYYVYLDEDELPEVLGGAARCQDTYQDWISLYCWTPFHATLMTTPEGSRCHWDQISSAYSELSGCTQLLAQLLSCPWPSSVLDAFFLQRLPPPGQRLHWLQPRAGPGGFNPVAPGVPGPDGFQMQPLAHERSRTAPGRRWRVRLLCRDVCRGAQSPARSSFCSREGPSELYFITL